MEIFPQLSFIFLIIVASLVQTNANGIGELPRSPKPEPEPPIQASTCPQFSAISPCSCTKEPDGIQIDCYDSTVDQTSVENAFKELRRVNEIPADRGFYIYQFLLHSTELTQFDLAPLYGSRLDYLDIFSNYNLTNLVTSGHPQDHGSIHVDTFGLSDACINEAEFGDTLKYFSVQMTGFSALRLANSPNSNNTDESEFLFEFLPGLSAFVNLNWLQLWGCNISGRLTSSHFNNFPRLSTIDLKHNNIDGVGENVFPSNLLQISLERNKLSETSIHPKSGIAQTGSRKNLDLSSNQITTLPLEIFQTFLDAHPQNYLYLWNNPLICDERLSWIKSRRDEFQSRVSGANCNDPGHTVFTSEMIP